MEAHGLQGRGTAVAGHVAVEHQHVGRVTHQAWNPQLRPDRSTLRLDVCWPNKWGLFWSLIFAVCLTKTIDLISNWEKNLYSRRKWEIYFSFDFDTTNNFYDTWSAPFTLICMI
jgi:hypothetical protein